MIPEDHRRCYESAFILSMSPLATTDWDWPTKMIGHALKANNTWAHHRYVEGMVLLAPAGISPPQTLSRNPWPKTGTPRFSTNSAWPSPTTTWATPARQPTGGPKRFWLEKTAPTLPDSGDLPLPLPAEEWLAAQLLLREADGLLKDTPPVPERVLIWHGDFTDPKNQPFGPENNTAIQLGFRKGVYFSTRATVRDAGTGSRPLRILSARWRCGSWILRKGPGR